MAMLCGFLSLAFDASAAYELRQRLSAVADSAALAAALEVSRGNTANFTAFAQRQVDDAVTSTLLPSGVSLTARLCSNGSATCTGGAAGSGSYVEVILSKTTPTMFASLMGFSSLTPAARAVAGVSGASGCVLSLASSGTGVSIGNNGEIEAQNCSVMANSNATGAINVSNNAHIDATGGSVGTTGTCSIGNNGSVTPACRTAVPPANDPLAGLPAPAAGTCATASVGNNGSLTINPGTYCSISVSNNGRLTMNPGQYVLTGSGGISLSNNSVLTGSGVYIYNGGTGAISFSNNVTVTLSAQTSGTYAGVLIHQATTNTSPFEISNNGSFSLTGALYLPAASFSLSNNAITSANCSLVVAQRVSISNNGTLTPNNACTSFGGSPIRSVALAE